MQSTAREGQEYSKNVYKNETKNHKKSMILNPADAKMRIRVKATKNIKSSGLNFT